MPKERSSGSSSGGKKKQRRKSGSGGGSGGERVSERVSGERRPRRSRKRGADVKIMTVSE
jgi:hypothetical protein